MTAVLDIPPFSPAARELGHDFARSIRGTRPRSLLDFARQVVILPPGGPCAGQRFDPRTLPFTGPLLEAIGSMRWSRIALVGPAQAFKTLCAQIVLTYRIFELHERVIFGLPDLRMANAKWQDDIWPILQASGLDRYLPAMGSGSRGGKVTDSVQFLGHGHLRFMSAGGRASGRKGPTASVLIATEADELDVATRTGGKEPKLADNLTLMEQRTNAFMGDPRRLTLMESTATTSQGRIWRELKGGTDSRLACPCPHCGEYVSPDREDLRGWREAENELQAASLSYWACPRCQVRISEDDRREMNLRGILLHRGQTIERKDDDDRGGDSGAPSHSDGKSGSVCSGRANGLDISEPGRDGNDTHRDVAGRDGHAGVEYPDVVQEASGEDSRRAVRTEAARFIGDAGFRADVIKAPPGSSGGPWIALGRPAIVGPLPPTRTFGFRWTAWEVLWWTAAELGALEWKAQSDPNPENSERTLCQDKWGRFWDSPQLDLTQLDWLTVARRTSETRSRGYVPAGTACLTAGIDVHKRLLYWTLLAFSVEGSPHVVDYGIEEVASDDVAEERALLLALRDWRERAAAGWPVADSDGERASPEIVFVDSGYQGAEQRTYPVYAFVREAAEQISDVNPAAYYAAKGLGASQAGRAYTAPRATGNVIIGIGDGYHIVDLREHGVYLVEVDADQWKGWVQARCRTPRSAPGALTLFAVAKEREHIRFCQHLTAERQLQEWDRRRDRPLTRWVGGEGKNHFLDATYLAGAAGHLAGVRLLEEGAAAETAEDVPVYKPGLAAADGGSFVAIR